MGFKDCARPTYRRGYSPKNLVAITYGKRWCANLFGVSQASPSGAQTPKGRLLLLQQHWTALHVAASKSQLCMVKVLTAVDLMSILCQ